MGPTHPTSILAGDTQPPNAPPTLGRRCQRHAAALSSLSQSEHILHCCEHFPFAHPGWDQAHPQEDEGKCSREVQKLKEEETAKQSQLGNSPTALACRREDERLLTVQHIPSRRIS